MSAEYVTTIRAQELADIPIPVPDLLERVQKLIWMPCLEFRNRLKELRMKPDYFNNFCKKIPSLLEEAREGLARKEFSQPKDGHPATLNKLYELIKDEAPTSTVDLARLALIGQSKLWTEQPLADITNLGRTNAVIPAVEQGLAEREKSLLPEWKSIEYALKEANASEDQIIAWKKELDEFAQNEAYYSGHGRLDVTKRKPSYSLISGTNHRYISPYSVQREIREKQAFIPIAQLRANHAFLHDLAFLLENFKPEYELPDRSPAFNYPAIEKMLSEEGLVQNTVIENAAMVRKDLPYYIAAMHRRHNFQNRVSHGAIDTLLMNELWAQFFELLHARLRGDEQACRLINGQSEGSYTTKSPSGGHFFDKLSDAYYNKQLTVHRLQNWFKYHKMDITLKITLRGEHTALDSIDKMATLQLDRHYEQCLHKSLDYITEDEFKNTYPQAISRFQHAVDETMAEISRITPAPAQSTLPSSPSQQDQSL